jgi:hypothetical protein
MCDFQMKPVGLKECEINDTGKIYTAVSAKVTFM